MGGLLIVLAAAIAFLPLTDCDAAGADDLRHARSPAAAIGFLDDYIKLRHQRSLGLRGRWKMLLLLGITVAVGLRRAPPAARPQRLRPGRRLVDPARAGLVRALFLIIAGAANGVNLTDGLDGLAAGTSIIALVDVHRDGGDDLHPLEHARRTAASRTGSTSRSSARR